MTGAWPQPGSLGWTMDDEPRRYDGERWHRLPVAERDQLRSARFAAQRAELQEMHAVAGPIEAGWTLGRKGT